MSKDSEQPDHPPAEPTDDSLDTSDVRVGKAINREIDAGIDDREASTVSRIDSPGSPAEIADLLRVAGMIRGGRDPLADLVRLGIVQPCTDGSELRLDKYKILGLLGEGGMGIVLAAEDTKLHRQLAIKVLRPDVARSPAAIPRFFREARAIAALAHPNVVSIHAVGEAGGLPWYAMQFVRGPTVAQWVRRHGPRPAESVRKIAVGMFRGLRVIHDAGIVHRDIKSSNLLLEGIGPEDTEVDGPDRVKIADFGLVRWQESQTQLTISDNVLGTPEYMSPEQARGGEGLDHRTDLYSAGVVLYELITGKNPFRSGSAAAVLHRIQNERPDDPRLLLSQVDDALADLVVNLVEKEPWDRPSSAEQVLDILESGARIRSPRKRRVRRKVVYWFLAMVIATIGVAFGVRRSLVSQSVSRISAIRVEKTDEGGAASTVLVRFGDDAEWKVFKSFKDRVYPAIVDLNGQGSQIVVVGTAPPVGDDCLFAYSTSGEQLWSLPMSDGRQWPDNGPASIWSCEAILSADLDGVPGDELIVACTDLIQYPSRLSVIDPRTREVRSNFWHFGRFAGMFVSTDFFGAGRHAIVAWGHNNKLDGFDGDPLPGDDPPRTGYDIVKFVMIVDPLEMSGLGPPRTRRLPDLAAATPYAYAFLDTPISLKHRIRPMHAWEVERYPADSELADLKSVTPSTVPSDSSVAPWFRVTLEDSTAGLSPSLYLDRHLDFHYTIAARPAAETDAFWRERWKVVMREGKYVGD